MIYLKKFNIKSYIILMFVVSYFVYRILLLNLVFTSQYFNVAQKVYYDMKDLFHEASMRGGGKTFYVVFNYLFRSLL